MGLLVGGWDPWRWDPVGLWAFNCFAWVHPMVWSKDFLGFLNGFWAFGPQITRTFLLVRFSHMGEGRGKQRFSNQTFGFIYLGNKNMEELDHHFWVDLDLNLEGLFAAKTTLSISPEWWKSHLMHESLELHIVHHFFFWCNQGPLAPPKPRRGNQNLPGWTTRRFDVSYKQKIELPHVATLVNGLANALGENGNTESDEVPRQFECRFQAPTPVGVGWMEQDPTARVKKTPGRWLDKISSQNSGFLALDSQVIMPESGEVAELIFTEISNGFGEELSVRVDGKEGGVSVH